MSLITLHANADVQEDNVIFLSSGAADFGSYSFVKEPSYFSKKAEEKENQVFSTPSGSFSVVTAQINKSTESATNQLEDYRRLGAKAYQLLATEKAETARFVTNSSDTALVRSFLEGLLLASYRYEQFKTEKSKHSLKEVFVVGTPVSEAEICELTNTVEAVFLARDLVNEPVITLNAENFSKAMSNAGDTAGFTTTVLDKAAIEAHKMGGLLGVNRGSIDPPTFNIMEWKPENATNEQPLVLVGKGIVYDTGGNNLKTGGYMLTMKSDMGGGAAVTGAMYAIAKNKLPLWVVGLVPATDNRIGKNALVADDVITMSDGTSVEVKNTDAEGRLVLADALVYAKKYNPALVIDMATLTGAGAAITGPFGIAMVHDSKKHVTALSESGEATYERLAELPFWREYDELLKSDIADMSNLGGPIGGSTTAGKFLHHFTDYEWIHLDIAGPAYIDKPSHYSTTGGTGVGVRLIYDFAKKMAQ